MSQIPREALDNPAAWRGRELSGSGDWIQHFDEESLAELAAAARAAAATGKPLEALGRDDFPLPKLAATTAAWLDELDRGRGFLLLRGLPVERWGDELSRLAYLGLGLHMGRLSSQNAAGDLLGHVRDTGADPNDPAVRLYKTRKAQPFHTDGADVIGLLCLRTAKRGGASHITSSISVFREIQERRPELVPLLFEPFHFDRNEEQAPGEAPTFQLPICHFDGQRLRTFYVGWYIRDAQRHPSVPRLTQPQRELLDLIDALAVDPELRLDMDFRPGDIQLLKNSSILHGRAEYEDWDEPARKRHLLRIWVTAHSRFSGSVELVQGIPAKPGVQSDSNAL
jgi:hypothetical protein